MRTEVIELLPRAGQVVFSAVCIATSSSIVFQTQPRIPAGILVALCAAGLGLVWSMFRIIVPAFSRKVGKSLPGFIDLLISAALAGSLIAAGATTAAAGACHALPDGTAIIVPRFGNGPLLGNSSSNNSPPSIESATFVIPPAAVHTAAGPPLQMPQPPGNPAASTAALSSAAVGRRRARLLQGLASSSSSSSSSSASDDAAVLVSRLPGLRRLLAPDAKPARNPALLLCSAWDATITLCFISFMFFAISGAIGILDVRLGKGLLVFKRRTAAAKEAQLAGSEDGGDTAAGPMQRELHEVDGDADVIIVPLSQLAAGNASVSAATAAWGRASLDRLMLHARAAAEARGQA
ncbi:hypothetical protein OEZ85_009011 [Tetradesmus obliquus]|uniref:Uncharacterized protein n=1 Tax=Tetradesmus obliquus TaxID=3088 RepID=A0ABY8TKI7_TETOB|nr:hypothetical protein OEZ85_009011 [Tetradesmus obliquus]